MGTIKGKGLSARIHDPAVTIYVERKREDAADLHCALDHGDGGSCVMSSPRAAPLEVRVVGGEFGVAGRPRPRAGRARPPGRADRRARPALVGPPYGERAEHEHEGRRHDGPLRCRRHDRAPIRAPPGDPVKPRRRGRPAGIAPGAHPQSGRPGLHRAPAPGARSRPQAPLEPAGRSGVFTPRLRLRKAEVAPTRCAALHPARPAPKVMPARPET
jgi:hypothetical protein